MSGHQREVSLPAAFLDQLLKKIDATPIHHFHIRNNDVGTTSGRGQGHSRSTWSGHRTGSGKVKTSYPRPSKKAQRNFRMVGLSSKITARCLMVARDNPFPKRGCNLQRCSLNPQSTEPANSSLPNSLTFTGGSMMPDQTAPVGASLRKTLGDNSR